MIQSARAAAGFLTIAGGAAHPDRHTAAWFAPVGALVGALVGLAWWGANELWAPLVAATIAVGVDAALTGLLHLDGLADSADGLIPPMERPRRLAVMADPQAGAFAVVVVVVMLAIRVASLASLDPDPLLLAGLWAMSRGIMGVVLARGSYARPEGGLASAFRGTPVGPALAGAGVGFLVLLVAQTDLPHAVVGGCGLIVGSAAVILLAQRRLGGFTGDVLGAAGVVGETCGLLFAAARW